MEENSGMEAEIPAILKQVKKWISRALEERWEWMMLVCSSDSESCDRVENSAPYLSQRKAHEHYGAQ